MTIGDNAARTFCLAPFQTRKIVYQRVSAGEFEIWYKHRDGFLAANRKEAHFELSAPGVSGDQLAKRSEDLSVSNRKHAFGYLGGGRQESGVVEATRTFELDQPKAFVEMTVRNNADRYLNFDFLRLVRLRKAAALRLAHKDMEAIVAAQDGIEKAHVLIYADIDLNIADGSSIWFSSMITMLSSHYDCVVVSKKNLTSRIIVSNIKNKHAVHIIEPQHLAATRETIGLSAAIDLIEQLDDRLPNLRRVFIRGREAAAMLHRTRRFKERSAVYLTDFYIVGEGGRETSEEAAADVTLIVRHSGSLLAQTDAIAEEQRRIAGQNRPFTTIAPPIPDDLPPPTETVRTTDDNSPIRIGYAGKISPNWGVGDLFNWSKRLTEEDVTTELTIVANKISGGALPVQERETFVNTMTKLLETRAAAHYSEMNREEAMATMAAMDFVWCYRPASLEENTLELSTKLVEMVAAGKPCLCYPNQQNIAALGEDYPFFIQRYDDFKQIVKNGPYTLEKRFADRVQSAHSITTLTKKLVSEVIGEPSHENLPRLGVAAHDPKFVDAFISYLKDQGAPVRQDYWEWGGPEDLNRSRALLEWADILFCEWGLANAVWFAEQNTNGKPLFVRMHLQEINPRAKKFGAALAIENVTRVIFVSERVRDEAVKMWNWPQEKTIVIPNYVLGDEYLPTGKPRNTSTVNLGMVGIIPQRKRFDRAVDLLQELLSKGVDAQLFIKGPRPETLDYMRVPGRAAELQYYEEVYTRVAGSLDLRDKVTFEPWGNDVASWYEKIDVMLSCSDFESFHYALADGVLSGCLPLIWPWDEADKIYTDDWIVTDTNDAVERVQNFIAQNETDKRTVLERNRALVLDRYGSTGIFNRLYQEIFGASV
ncbi:MAG: hypothetical protein AAF224_03385 [Pseudomonadota bacterium]